MILLGGCVTAKQLISFKGQLKVWTVVKVLMSQILNIPDISADMIWLELGNHLTPTREWLCPLSKKIFFLT